MGLINSVENCNSSKSSWMCSSFTVDHRWGAVSKVHSHVDYCRTACMRTRGYYSILWFTIALYVLESIWRPHRIWLLLWPIFRCTGATQCPTRPRHARIRLYSLLGYTGYATMSCNSIRYNFEPHTIGANEMYLFLVNECVIKSDTRQLGVE